MIPHRLSALPRSLLAASFCAGLLWLTPQASRADTLQEANRLMKQGQLGAALEKTDQALAARPKDAQARFLKGLVLTEMNRHDEAIAVFTRLTEDYPELPEPYNNLAVLYAQLRQYDKARSALEMAIRVHPSYATAHENLGDLHARIAGQAYEKALQIDASNAGAQAKLALIRDLMGVSSRPATPVSRNTPGTVQATPTLAAKAEAAPAARPEPPSSVQPVPTDGSRQEVEKTLHDWAAAWSRKDVKTYLAAYAPDFRTPGGQARSAWEADRTRRINKAGPFQVDLENIQATVKGDRAEVTFRQIFRWSGKPKAFAASKSMVLVRRDGKWLIQQERAGN